jgi:hypothetical protein
MSPSTAVDEDAKLAAKLQAEWNGSRPSRSAATRKAAPSKKRKNPVKSKARGKGEDDSDIGSGDGEEKKKNVTRTGGFHVSRPSPSRQLTLLIVIETVHIVRPSRIFRWRDFCKSSALNSSEVHTL